MIWALHGNLGDGGDWETVAELLAPRQVIAPCLWDASPREFGCWAKSFVATVEEECGRERVLLGYSLGARLAMHALLERPALWTAAIFVSGHPGLEDEAGRVRRLRDDLAWAERLRSLTPVAFAEAWNAQPVLAGQAQSSRQIEILRAHGRAIASAFDQWSLARQGALREPLRACRVPQCWVAGAGDAKFAALAESMAGGASEAGVFLVPDCGHRVLLQKPAELAECVRTFLNDRNLE